MKYKMLVFLLMITFSSVILFAQVTPDEVLKIEKAVDQLPKFNAPAKKLLLVFSLSGGYKHQAIAYADKMLQIMAEKTGAFSVVISKDLNVFNEPGLKSYDGILFNNTTDLEFTAEQRASILSFIKSGKGIAGIHAATDNFKNWPEALEMMGGVFDGHPWGASGTWAVKNSDPGHILNKSFNGKDFRISDEIYRVKPFNLRKNSRVLLALDMKDKTNLAADGVLATDKDIPISWIREYGKGRLFYCSFGHNSAIYWNEQILAHYLAGIRFTLGEINADTQPLPFDAKDQINPDELKSYLNQIKDYEFGQSKAVQNNITTYLRYASVPDLAADAEIQFIDFLKSDASLPAKQFICEQLSIYGTETSLPVLSELLHDDKTFAMAIFAIDRIKSPLTIPVLTEALKNGSPDQKVSVINTLSKFENEELTKVLLPLTFSKNEKVAIAAIKALPAVCNDDIIEKLSADITTGGTEKKYAVYNALLKCADKKSSEDKGSALEIYTKLFAGGNPYNVRFASLHGMLMLSNQPADLLYELISSKNAENRQIAVQLVNNLDSKMDLSRIASLLTELPEIEQVQLIAAFKGKGDSDLTRVIENSLKSENAVLRETVLKTLTENADKTSVKILAEFCAQAGNSEKQLSRETLALIHGPGIDQEIIRLISESEAKVKNELIFSAGERQIADAGDVVFNETLNSNPEIRKSAYAALAVIAQPELLDGLLQNLNTSTDENQNPDIEKAVVGTVSRADIGKSAQLILEKFTQAKNTLTINSYFSMMSQIAAKEFLPVLRQGLQNPDSEIKTAAVRALANWPDTDVSDDLYNLSDSNNKTHHTLAYRGYLRIVQQAASITDSEKVELIKRISETAKDDSDYQLLLSNLSKNSNVEGLKMASIYLDKPQLRETAIVSILAIAERLHDPVSDEAIMILEKIKAGTEDENVLKKSNDLINKWRQKNN